MLWQAGIIIVEGFLVLSKLLVATGQLEVDQSRKINTGLVCEKHLIGRDGFSKPVLNVV